MDKEKILQIESWEELLDILEEFPDGVLLELTFVEEALKRNEI